MPTKDCLKTSNFSSVDLDLTSLGLSRPRPPLGLRVAQGELAAAEPLPLHDVAGQVPEHEGGALLPPGLDHQLPDGQAVLTNLAPWVNILPNACFS